MLRRCVAVGTDLPLAGCTTNARVALVVSGLNAWHLHSARSSRESRTKLPAAERLCAASYTQEDKVWGGVAPVTGLNVIALIGAVIPRVSGLGCFEAIGRGQGERWTAAATQEPWMWCPSWKENPSFKSREGKLSVVFCDFCFISAVPVCFPKCFFCFKQKVSTYIIITSVQI